MCMDTTVRTLLLLLLFCFFACSCFSSPIQIFYVMPHNYTGDCPSSNATHCQTLESYVKRTDQYFHSSTTFCFLPGTHTLNRTARICNITKLSLLGDVSNFNFVGKLSNYTKTCALVKHNFTTPAVDKRQIFRKILNFDNFVQVNRSASPSQHSNPLIQCLFPPSASGGTGLHFCNVSHVHIERLRFVNCGHTVHFGPFPYNSNSTVVNSNTALSVNTVWSFSVTDVQVNRSYGNGLYGLNIFGHSSISRSLFSMNSVKSDGGNVQLFWTNCSHIDTLYKSFLEINSTQFLNGNASNDSQYSIASGLGIWIQCTNIVVSIYGVTARNNAVNNHTGLGGNMLVLFRNWTHLINTSVTISDCHIEAGYASYGGGIAVNLLEFPHNSYSTGCCNSQRVVIRNTRFLKNRAYIEGGGLYIIVHEMPGLLESVGRITIENCSFNGNRIDNFLNGGAAVHINNHYMPGFLKHVTPQYNISLTGCVFSNSNVTVSPPYYIESRSKVSTVFVIQNRAGVHFTNCTIQNNSISGLTVVRSNVIMHGNIHFQNNTGFDGGGLLLSDSSFLYLTRNTTIRFIDNHATNSGGGIFVSTECFQAIPTCFFQLKTSFREQRTALNTIHIHMENNTASYAGSAIYGAAINSCEIMQPGFFNSKTLYGREIFSKVFKVQHNKSDLSYISSDPFEVCFCDSKNRTNCSVLDDHREIYPGASISVHLAAVGYMKTPAPGTIAVNTTQNVSVGDGQALRKVTKNCQHLSFTVSSSVESGKLYLSIQQRLLPEPPEWKFNNLHVNLTFKPCPIGFSRNELCKCCQCCKALQAVKKVECTLTRIGPVIVRKSNSWIGTLNIINRPEANEAIIIYQQYCPLDHCLPGVVNITVNETDYPYFFDVQCANNRTGILCGQCAAGMSVVFGSSKCATCSNRYLALLPLFAVAGIALIAFLNIFNLTVSDGTLNTLIFYANIIQVNSFVFKLERPEMLPLRIFTAWLNLDFGFQMCFFDGMDSFYKTLLQFSFPAYIIFLAYLIILLSRRYVTASRLLGANAVQVLATLILLCYAKILRIIIAAFSATRIVYPDNRSEYRWTPDGNTMYFEPKHIVIFVAGLVAMIISLPFTFVVTYYQCLQRANSNLCSCVHRLKPILDAYGGPYSDQCRFWTGLQLHFRIILFVVFAANIKQSPYTNLLAILFICLINFSLGWGLGGVYKTRKLNTLEIFHTLNLAILSLLTLNYYSPKPTLILDIVVRTSVGSAAVSFGFTLLHRSLKIIHRFKNVSKFSIPDFLFPLKRSKQLCCKVVDSNDSDDDDDGAGLDEYQSLLENI